MKGLRKELSTGKAMLTPLLLSAVLFSCSKEDLQEQSTQIDGVDKQLSVVSATSAIPNIIWEERFEGSTIWEGLHKQIGTSYGFTTATKPVFEGSKSGRFELRDSDPITSGGTRAEVLFPEQKNLNRWYSYAIYFPSADFKYDSRDEVITQWHQGGGVTQALCLRTGKDRLTLRVRASDSNIKYYDLGAIAKDKWQTFVMHVKHSSGSDGLIEMWIDGKKVVNHSGPNMYSLSDGFNSPLLKLGIYKASWNSGTTETTKRVLYFDDIRIGNENATYSNMTSGTSTTTDPAPGSTEEPASSTGTTTTTKVASFTLVNPDTEKDVMTISNGATISLSALGLKKVNIRANTSPSTVGSVKFQLSGSQSRTYTDNRMPYALHGDDGKGNYYYGNWYQSGAFGSYTLKATPYSNSNASGTAGTSNSISFTITK